MNTRTASSSPSITARPSPEEKARFVSVAEERGLTESALALSAIRAYLGVYPAKQSPIKTDSEPNVRPKDRITIRLRPGDGRWIAQRAQQRGMTRSAYLAALVRAHVSVNPPIPEEEIRILKRAVIGLDNLSRAISGVKGNELSGETLQKFLEGITLLDKRVQEFIRASLIAWESRGG